MLFCVHSIRFLLPLEFSCKLHDAWKSVVNVDLIVSHFRDDSEMIQYDV